MTGKDKIITDSVSALAGEPLKLSGGICNLMPMPLKLLDAAGKVQTTYACDTDIGPAYVCWKDEQGVECRMDFGIVAAEPLCNVQVIGGFNDGYIDLVRPTVDTTPIVEFWKKAVREDGVKTIGLPDMKPWRKRPGMSMYCVVSPFVALVAYFRFEELDRLLVPALPMTGDVVGYRALMPAEQLILCSSVERRL